MRTIIIIVAFFPAWFAAYWFGRRVVAGIKWLVFPF